MLTLTHLTSLLTFLPLTTALALPTNITQKRGLYPLLDATHIIYGRNQFSSSSPNPVHAWIGDNGAYTITFTNTAPTHLNIVLWTSLTGPWVQAQQPAISWPLGMGQSVTVSLTNDISGAFSAVYPETGMYYGLISNTWGEFTFADNWSTFDVSREVNMHGRAMTIATKVPSCVSSTSPPRCVFTCNGGAATCGTSGSYGLENCAAGSQVGANTGSYANNPSGGCAMTNEQGFHNHLVVSLGA
jgi:hypothetical protein